MNHPAEVSFMPPNEDPESIPVLKVEGVQVGVYLDHTGTLQVAVDLDDASEHLITAQETVPIEISIQGQTVYYAP